MRRLKKSHRFLFAALIASTLGIFAFAAIERASAQVSPDWKQKWDRVFSEARKEGKVVVLGPPGELIREAMVQGFRRAYPEIQIEYSGGRSGEQATRLKAERDGGIYSADLLLGGTTTANTQLKPMKAQDPLKPALILPEVTDLKHWRDNRLEFSDIEGLYNLVFVNQLKSVLIYDLNQVRAEEVDELHELLDPRWKGKIVINDPLPSGAGNVTFRWIWQVLAPEMAGDYYRKIRAQAAVVDRDQRRQIEWVARGKYAMLLGPSDGVMAQLLQSGLKFSVLGEFREGGIITASFGSASLLNRAPHPNASIVFLNWVLGKEGQTAWSKAMDHVSRRLDVPTDQLPAYNIPKPGGRYWVSHHEREVTRSAEEEKILKELFGR